MLSILVRMALLLLTVFSDRMCPIEHCGFQVPVNSALCEHFLDCRIDFQPKVSPSSLVNILNDCSEDIIKPGLQLSKAV